jgi:hypothetical protein
MLVLVIAAAIPLALTTGNRRSAPQEENPSPLLDSSDVPEGVRAVLTRACANCHSENTEWPWYANLPPLSWQVHGDVEKARSFMDFSKWSSYSTARRRGYAMAISAAVEGGLMPPERYLLLHSEARLSGAERQKIREWAFGFVSASRGRSAPRLP